MKMQITVFVSLLLGCLFTVGCSPAKDDAPPATAPLAANDSHDHSGWWCKEHGVPEEVCGQCNSKVAAEFQKKGDWCKEHDRPDSQCFKCHPELQATFAAQYEAKYGKAPPTPEI